MEENKNKEIKMETTVQDNSNEPIPYEKLKEIANKLYEDNRYLKDRLTQAYNSLNAFNRLDYLLKVIRISREGTGFSEQFIKNCCAEVESVMTLPDKDTKENAEEN